MKLKLACILTGFLALSVGTYANADSDPIYVVDMQRVINESIVGKAARNNIESEVKKREGQLVKMQNDLKAMQGELEKQGSLLSADALKSKQQNFQKKQAEFQKTFEDNRSELAKKNNEEIGKIVKDIDGIIKEISKEKGYRIVIEKDQRFVVFVDSKFDLTEEITTALDKKKLDS